MKLAKCQVTDVKDADVISCQCIEKTYTREHSVCSVNRNPLTECRLTIYTIQDVFYRRAAPRRADYVTAV